MDSTKYSVFCAHILYHLYHFEVLIGNFWKFRFSTNSFVCDNGQTIDLAKMCNDFQDCTDDSDENPKFCSAIKCGTIFSSFCTKCETKNSFQILGKTYSYSNATSSDEVKCSALKQPEVTCLITISTFRNQILYVNFHPGFFTAL